MSPQRINGIVPRDPGSSLLTAASRFPQGIDWGQGVSFRQTHCPTVDTWAYCPGVDDKKATPSGAGLATFYPFDGYVVTECDSVLPENAAGELDPETQRQADATSAYSLSRELWEGDTNTGDSANPSLMRPFPGETDEFDPDHIIAGGPLAPVDAIGRLLAAYAEGTKMGGATLHIPPRLIPVLLQNGTISLTGQAMTVGNLAAVSPGPGYPGAGDTGPDGAAASSAQVWMYVTSPVEYDFGAVRLEPENTVARWFDRRLNKYFVLAERKMIYRFDPCAVWAVLVTVPTAA